MRAMVAAGHAVRPIAEKHIPKAIDQSKIDWKLVTRASAEAMLAELVELEQADAPGEG